MPRTGPELLFEIDEIDDFQSGWSVLAAGPPRRVAAGEYERLRSGSLPTTRDAGSRRSLGGTPCRQQTGRRFSARGWS